jgi:hypothetical protein
MEDVEIFSDPFEELKKSLTEPAKKPSKSKEKQKAAEVPQPPKAEGVGKYLEAALASAKREADEVSSEFGQKEKKKKSSGFGDFSSW